MGLLAAGDIAERSMYWGAGTGRGGGMPVGFQDIGITEVTLFIEISNRPALYSF